MSAYICNPDHIKALAIYASESVGQMGCRRLRVDPRYLEGGEAMHGRSQDELATYYANILYCENIRSVQARYPEDTFDNLPGPCEKPEMLSVSYQECCEPREWACYVLKPVDILKMCAGYEYQACETDDWDRTLAHSLLSKIRKAAINDLPGYEDAPWDYIKPPRPQRRKAA